MGDAPFRLLLISGSIRRRSTNTAALRAVTHLPTPGLDTVLWPGLADLPAFNPDDDGDGDALPPAAAALRREIHRADALLFSVPEYAGALPGALKNLLDWTIGDASPRSINGKPVGWVNASSRGAAGAHRELAVVLGYAGALVVADACVAAPISDSDLDQRGDLGDGRWAAQLEAAVRALEEVGTSAGG